jgi:predicted amidophosphoribosyltransferase
MFIDSIPKAFTCAGCMLTTWKSVCNSCKENLQWNQEFLPSPVSEMEALAPLLFSYSRTQTLIRRFKENGGNDLKRALFRMPLPLKNRLMETHFFAVVPIPQDLDRSYHRGHESARETAQYFAKQLSLPLFPALKLKSRKTKRLTGLMKVEREWAENQFVLANPRELLGLKGYALLQEKMTQGKEIRILLVDDLITSGSTLAKAGDTLKELYPNLKIWGAGIGFRPHRVSF